MGLGSSPKEVVKAISEGYTNLTVVSLRRYGTAEKLKQLLMEISVLERTVRNEIIPEDDFEATRKKHFRLGNLRKARNIITGFAKSRRIHL